MKRKYILISIAETVILATFIYINRVKLVEKFPCIYTPIKVINKVKDTIHEKQESKKIKKNVHIVINGQNYYLDDKDINNKKDVKTNVSI